MNGMEWLAGCRSEIWIVVYGRRCVRLSHLYTRAAANVRAAPINSPGTYEYDGPLLGNARACVALTRRRGKARRSCIYLLPGPLPDTVQHMSQRRREFNGAGAASYRRAEGASWTAGDGRQCSLMASSISRVRATSRPSLSRRGQRRASCARAHMFRF